MERHTISGLTTVLSLLVRNNLRESKDSGISPVSSKEVNSFLEMMAFSVPLTLFFNE